jgi:hypothetical protein
MSIRVLRSALASGSDDCEVLTTFATAPRSVTDSGEVPLADFSRQGQRNIRSSSARAALM